MIDLDKLRRISTDMAVWYEKDAKIVASSADEIERLRASELALKKRLVTELKKDEHKGLNVHEKWDALAEIKQLENELSEGGS